MKELIPLPFGLGAIGVVLIISVIQSGNVVNSTTKRMTALLALLVFGSFIYVVLAGMNKRIPSLMKALVISLILASVAGIAAMVIYFLD